MKIVVQYSNKETPLKITLSRDDVESAVKWLVKDCHLIDLQGVRSSEAHQCIPMGRDGRPTTPTTFFVEQGDYPTESFFIVQIVFTVKPGRKASLAMEELKRIFEKSPGFVVTDENLDKEYLSGLDASP